MREPGKKSADDRGAMGAARGFHSQPIAVLGCRAATRARDLDRRPAGRRGCPASNGQVLG
ncbi:hypothetical protein [Falsiroseomonas sp. E2-1-a4]|uniref:hypothetical protein n=1 Tax=Falsiroseomonas sp. E2-1-a4 TaxID=3239299 RepID=UPI003F410264